MSTLFVRLKPYDPKRGFVLRRLTVPEGHRFEETKGWYEVSEQLGKKLSAYQQKPHDPDSKPAFDVCTHAEALALERREKEERELADVDRARPMGVLVTEDLPKLSEPKVKRPAPAKPKTKPKAKPKAVTRSKAAPKKKTTKKSKP